MQDYKKLYAWQKAHSLVLKTYAISAHFPQAEQFGLTSQMRRAATSTPANIAEGACRGSKRTFAQFLRVAAGSAGELEYYGILAVDLTFMSQQAGLQFAADVSEVKKVISGLLTAVAKTEN